LKRHTASSAGARSFAEHLKGQWSGGRKFTDVHLRNPIEIDIVTCIEFKRRLADGVRPIALLTAGILSGRVNPFTGFIAVLRTGLS
jgi:hypothetical protein